MNYSGHLGGVRFVKKIFLECPDMVVRHIGVSTHSHILLSQQLYDLGKAYGQVERVDQLSLFNI